MLENGDNLDVIYLDFEKAFDKVDFGLLLAKLKALGITGKLGTWLGSFMIGRKQAVKIEDQVSEWVEVISGIPQGSVIGPLFFLIMIGDLGKDVQEEEAKVLKYVDDSKAMKGVKNEEDVSELQSVIGKLTNWQINNNMKFNSTKFQLLRFGNNLPLKRTTNLYIDSSSSPLIPSEEVRDLGVLIDDKADFKAQRLSAVSKAQKKAAWVLRTFSSRRPEILSTLWKSIVQPNLDYCSQAVVTSGPARSTE